MSFWGSLFGGQNETLSKDIGQTGSIAGFSSNLGQKNTSAGSDFFSSILSGDPAKLGQVLAPEISAMQKSGQQQKGAIAQFGNRSGGGNSAAQSIDSGNRANLTNLIGGLQQGAAGSLLSSGQNLLSSALGGFGQQAQLSQIQMQNWQNSILGKSISGGIGAAEGFGLGTGFNAISPSTFKTMFGGG